MKISNLGVPFLNLHFSEKAIWNVGVSTFRPTLDTFGLIKNRGENTKKQKEVLTQSTVQFRWFFLSANNNVHFVEDSQTLSLTRSSLKLQTEPKHQENTWKVSTVCVKQSIPH